MSEPIGLMSWSFPLCSAHLLCHSSERECVCVCARMCAVNVWTNWIQILLLWAVGCREGGAGAFSSSPVVHYSCMCRFHQRTRSYISRLCVSIIYAIFDVYKSHTEHFCIQYMCASVCSFAPILSCAHGLCIAPASHSISFSNFYVIFVIAVCYSCMLNVF